MVLDVLMPVITASGEEAVVTAWLVDEGEACSDGQLIAEVQVEKISTDVEAPGAGYVVDRVPVNHPVAQGGLICRIVESVKEAAAVPAAAPPAAKDEALRPTVVASPAAKRAARELGVDLSGVAGSGPGGRITEADVFTAAERIGHAPSGMRAVIARNMRRSHAETAPVTLHSIVDLGDAVPPHITAIVVKTVAETLPDHPHLNGRRNGDVFTSADVAQVAVAIETQEGLVAPVVRNAASRSVEEVAEAIKDLAERAAAKTLIVEDFEGGTFTVTNLGSYGIDGFTPLINLPQVAILGIGALRRVPVIDEHGEVIPGNQIVLSLTFDHAFVDGAPAATFLRQVGEALTGS
jgi:pyruvate dehydrogenase E2 component (dihydrolipoamide acetyltransferase)